MKKSREDICVFIDGHKAEMLKLWEDLVMTESYSGDAEGVNTVAEHIKCIIEKDGASVRTIEHESNGKMLVGTFGTDRKYEPVCFLGHMDTVFKKGTIATNPFRIADGKAYGPGVLDMKGGIVVLLYAIKALEASGYNLRPLKIVLAGDEEIAHEGSTAAETIVKEVAGSIAAFNCETGYPDGRIVTSRKGAATFMMEAFGVAAHSGNNPQVGRNAILELAYKTIDIEKLTDWEVGTNFNVGTVEGGTVVNSIPAQARIGINVRCASLSSVEKFTRELNDIKEKVYINGVRTTLTGGLGIIPMEANGNGHRLFNIVNQTSVENGFGELTPFMSGGGSDSAYSVFAGVPTVCSMGVKGEHNHTMEEYAIVDSLFERAKLLAACVLNLDHQN